MGTFVKASTRKLVGVSALSALTLVELIQIQQANAAPVVFTGSVQPDGGFGGNLQVAITVDAVGGIYKITGITTPVQPTGNNGAYANFAIPTLTSEALVAQSASITGVSGASSISAAWIKSLASAIAAAATAGERIDVGEVSGKFGAGLVGVHSLVLCRMGTLAQILREIVAECECNRHIGRIFPMNVRDYFPGGGLLSLRCRVRRCMLSARAVAEMLCSFSCSTRSDSLNRFLRSAWSIATGFRLHRKAGDGAVC